MPARTGDASWFLQVLPPQELGYVPTGTAAAQLWAGNPYPRLRICLVGHDADSADAFLERVAPWFGYFLQRGDNIDFYTDGSYFASVSVDCRLWPDICTIISHEPNAALIWDGERAWGAPYQAEAVRRGFLIGSAVIAPDPLWAAWPVSGTISRERRMDGFKLPAARLLHLQNAAGPPAEGSVARRCSLEARLDG